MTMPSLISHATYAVLLFPLLVACDAPGANGVPGANDVPGDSFSPDATDEVTDEVTIPSAPVPILVAVNDDLLTQHSTAYFSSTVTRMAFRVAIADTTPVTITGIGWDRGPSGFLENNPHLELRPANLIALLPSELATPQAELRFDVQLTTDWAFVHDFSPSVLVITTTSQDALGTPKTHEFRLTLAISNFPLPQVNPDAFTFPHISGQQVKGSFMLYQGATDGRFTVRDVRFERPSNELTLQHGGSAIGSVIDGHSLHGVPLTVDFRPQSNALLDNALLIDTDATDEPLRIPLTSAPLFEAHELTFSDPNHFDFRGATTTTRSVTVKNTGSVSIRFEKPEVISTSASPAFAVKGYVGTRDIASTFWPLGLPPGQSLRFEVTYTPTTGAANGQLVLFYAVEPFASKTIDFHWESTESNHGA